MKAAVHFWDHWSAYTGYETKSEAVLLGIENDYLGFSVQTDNLDIDKAYYANVSWYVKLAF